MKFPIAFLRHAVCTFAFGASLVAVQAADTLMLRADNWFPYNGEPADARPGYVIEIARLIIEKDGGKLDYTIMPWKRAVAEAEKGTVNGVIGALKSDTPGFVFPEQPIGFSGTSAFVKKGSSWKYTGIDSIKSLRAGIVDGYSYGEGIDGYIEANKANPKAIDISVGDLPEQVAIKKLQAGRIDVYLSDPTVFRARVTAMGLDQADFIDAGIVAEALPIYISLSPKRADSAAWAAKLDAGIKALRQSGELAAILKKYGVSDWAGRP